MIGLTQEGCCSLTGAVLYGFRETLRSSLLSSHGPQLINSLRDSVKPAPSIYVRIVACSGSVLESYFTHGLFLLDVGETPSCRRA